MAQGYGQKELISKQREFESVPRNKLPVKEGSIVEFIDEPEFNGVVRRISKDQWQTVYIDYGNEGKSKFIHGAEFTDLYSRGKIVVKNVKIKKGTKIFFSEQPEDIFTIENVKKDQWQTLCIAKADTLEVKELKGFEFIRLLENGSIKIKK